MIGNKLEALKSEILQKLNIQAELETLGFKFAGKPNGRGYAPLFNPYKAEQRPSCGVNLTDPAHLGLFCSFNQGNGNGGNSGKTWSKGFFDLTADFLPECSGDYLKAIRHYADKTGVVFQHNNSKRRRLVRAYSYLDEHGQLVFQVCRYEPKDFKQRRPDGKGGYIYNLQGVVPVPYNLPEVFKADTVYIAEGEKDCQNLRALGLVASCNHGGAGKWRADFARYFKGKHCIILPDNDEPGRNHGDDVAGKLRSVAASVKIVHLPGLPEKGDVSDWTTAGGTAEQLKALVDAAPPAEIGAAQQQILKISDVTDWLHIEPPPQEFIFNQIFVKGITGFIHAVGGVGKSSMINCMVFSLTTGATLWGIFEPARAFKVMLLPGEDSEGIVRRRFYLMALNLSNEEREQVQQALKNLILICGQPLPLLKLENGNPVFTDGFWTLYELIKQHRPDVLVLDPKSMFFGSLDENSNSHNAAFIACLKKFNDLGVSVIFTHHESKALSGQGSQFGSRGGQALSDGARWQVSLSEMTDAEGEKYGVNPSEFVKVSQTKSNYTRFFEPFFLRRCEHGVLELADLQHNRQADIICACQQVLLSGISCKHREISCKEGQAFRQEIKAICGATLKELRPVLSIALVSGQIKKDSEGRLYAA